MLTFSSPGMICTDETELVTVTAVFAFMSTKTCILDADLIMKCKHGRYLDSQFMSVVWS